MTHCNERWPIKLIGWTVKHSKVSSAIRTNGEVMEKSEAGEKRQRFCCLFYYGILVVFALFCFDFVFVLDFACLLALFLLSFAGDATGLRGEYQGTGK